MWGFMENCESLKKRVFRGLEKRLRNIFYNLLLWDLHVRSVSWLNCLRRQFALYHCLLFTLVFLFYNCSVHALVCLFNFVYSLLIFVIDFVYILFFVCSLLIFVLFCMYCICSFMSTSTTYYLLIWLLLFTYFTVASLCFYTKQNLLH